MAERIAILLRGVNLGRRNKVPMAQLRTLCDRLGLEQVSTYIASGNIICAMPDDVTDTLARLESAIADEFDVATPAIARTHQQLVTVTEHNPYADFEPKLMQVTYLAGVPDADGASTLTERDFGADTCRVLGTEVYARYAENTHGSKLSAAVIEKHLGVAGTARNWRSALKLAELTA